MTSTPQPLPLPQAAQSRLGHERQSGAATTAFLTFGEYLTLEQMGFQPICGVVGISVVHRGGVQFSGLKQAAELTAYSQAIAMGLHLASARLQEEAGTLGADGVLMHSIEERHMGGEEHEYAWAGTAVRFVPSPGALRTADGLPFICNAPVPALYQLMRRGLAPVTYGSGVCVYHVPHRTMRQALGQTFQNTEVPVFTDAWYTAREIALARLQSMMEQQGADSVLQMSLALGAELFGEHTAEFRFSGHGWRRVAGLAENMPAIDLAPEAIVERGLLVTGMERHAPPPHAGAPTAG